MLLVLYTEVHQAGFSWPVSYLPLTPFDFTINCCYKDRKSIYWHRVYQDRGRSKETLIPPLSIKLKNNAPGCHFSCTTVLYFY